MIGLSELSSIISRVFYNEVRNSGRIQQQVCCPRCQERDMLPEPDGKFNLEINLAKHQFRCWKCEDPKFSGSLSYLLRCYGNREEYDEYKNFVTIYGYNVDESDEEKKIDPVKLPSEIIYFSEMFDFLPEHQEPYQYLINERKIKHEDIIGYNMGFCLEGLFKNRVIIPSYDEFGRLNYFVGRAFKKKMKPPYLNPDVEKENIIINEKNLNWDSTIYIVEGFFDLFSMPYNTTASLGKTLSKRLYNKLKAIKPNVVVMYDPDAFKDMIEVYETLKHMYGSESDKVKLVEIKGDNDIDEIRREQGEQKVKEILKTAREIAEEDYFKFKHNTKHRFQYVNESSRGYGFGQIDFV